MAWLESPNGLGAIAIFRLSGSGVHWTLVLGVVVGGLVPPRHFQGRAGALTQQGSVAEVTAAFDLNHFGDVFAGFVINVDFAVWTAAEPARGHS